MVCRAVFDTYRRHFDKNIVFDTIFDMEYFVSTYQIHLFDIPSSVNRRTKVFGRGTFPDAGDQQTSDALWAPCRNGRQTGHGRGGQ
ncbi:unnamed protein product, partial [Iphiclides podalirius]